MASHQELSSPLIHIFFFFFFFFFFFSFCSSTDTIAPIHPIKDGQTLISTREIFALGFFSPINSKNRYVGIWYNKVPQQTIVWVANRENPITNSSGVLAIIDGNLALINGRDLPHLWSTNVSTVANFSSATLLDSGNLVLKDGDGRVLWESFDYPTNSFLPGMKIGWDRRTGLNRLLTSWKTTGNPARGEFSYGLDLRGQPQLFLMKGSDPIHRSGPWNGLRLTGALNPSLMINFQYVDNEDEVYWTYQMYDSSILSRLVVDESGTIQRWMWIDKSRRWNLAFSIPKDQCDDYVRCGPYGNCDPTSLPESQCTCLRGFEPRSVRGWQVGNWSGGCVRRRALNCGKGDGFLRLAHMKVPDTSRARVETSWSLKACEEECLKNCSCTAYANANVTEGGSGCVMWDGDLVDLKVQIDAGQDLYTRVDASEIDETSYGQSRGSLGVKKVVVAVSVVAAVLIFISCGYYWWRKKLGRKMNKRCSAMSKEEDFEEGNKGSELSLFHSDVIVASTNNFSEGNMLGEGGFGSVYKGKLLNGQEIAVKRLSKSSAQGIEEFKNEVSLIAKLQHRNLVRILGCCIDGEEKMLIYEYMQNKSLDYFIFDQTEKAMLDWRRRFIIIVGIARGILYLHEDSRLRIVHRDLKISNVLLDDEMNPKISDFGLARIFGENQTQGQTNRVVGTYGYMSPEYAINGLFSVKSDVFSFGIILLEIIGGKKNNSYNTDGCLMTLTEYVWKLWKEGKVLEFVDSSMSNSSQIEVSRCIQVGLLCVEEHPKDRPTMSSVIFMLGNETTIPLPKQPAFCLQREECCNHLHSSTNGTNCSRNEVTITEVEAR